MKEGQWPPWFAPRLPLAAECTLCELIAQRSARAPSETLLVLPDGTSRSNRDVLEQLEMTAARLRSTGIAKGDYLPIWLPNGPDLLRWILAAWRLGAIPVPLNPALRGSPLQHALEIADAHRIITHPELLGRLAELPAARLAALSMIVVAGESPRASRLAPRACPEAALAGADPESATNTCQPWEVAAVVFSSGTTGVPKGVMVTFAQLWSLGQAFYGYLEPRDRMLLMYPLFHVAALGALFGALSRGASLAITESFRATEFVEVIGRTGATCTPGLGRTLVDAVNKATRGTDLISSPLRIVNVQSVNPAVREFSQRFRCALVPSYSMTETSGICVGPIEGAKDGSMGRPRSGLQVRLVDEHDQEVPRGQPGEVIVRSDLPWVFNAGYLRNPEATASAWRNGWFHTGDIARQDAEGDLYFLDRSRDVIRRRSENISSLEIEAEARQHPLVQDAAAIGIETPDGEEVLLVVAPLPGASLDPQQLIEFLIARLPHFMVPRFVRMVVELPKTQQTNRVQKSELRREGLTPDCWDREAAGMRLRRERLTDT